MVDFGEVTTLPVAVQPGPIGRSAARPRPGHPVGEDVSRSGTLGVFLARSWRTVADPAGREDRSARRVAEFPLGRAWLVAVLCGVFGLGLVLVALMMADVRSPSAPVVSVADRPQLTSSPEPPALGMPAPRPTPASQQRDPALTRPPVAADRSTGDPDADSGNDEPDGDSHTDRDDQAGWQRAQDWARLGTDRFMPHRERPYPETPHPAVPYPGRPYPGGAFVGGPAPDGTTPSQGAFPGGALPGGPASGSVPSGGAYPGSPFSGGVSPQGSSPWDAHRSGSDGWTWHNYPTR